MAVNLMFTKGYEAGYKKGLQSGLNGSAARTIMQKDLIHIYGRLAIVLTEQHHWKQQSVQNLITEIQTAWQRANTEAESTTETMAEMVLRRTGIELRQMTEDILDGGWD